MQWVNKRRLSKGFVLLAGKFKLEDVRKVSADSQGAYEKNQSNFEIIEKIQSFIDPRNTTVA